MRSEIFSYLSSNSPSRNWDQLKKAFRKNYKKEEPAVINYWGGGVGDGQTNHEKKPCQNKNDNC